MNCIVEKIILSRSAYIIIFGMLLIDATIDALPYVTTFLNSSGINVNALIRLHDNNVKMQNIAIAQSYEVVNFVGSEIISIAISSSDKDKNGNLYGALQEKNLPKATDNITYEIKLEDVPAYQVAAIAGMEAYTMPASQKIICVPASPTSQDADKKDSKSKKSSA